MLGHCVQCQSDTLLEREQTHCNWCQSALTYKCNRCDNLYDNYASSRQHSSNCFRCDYCPFVTSAFVYLTRHVRGNHVAGRQPKLPCPACGKKFVLKRDLVKHKRSYCRKFNESFKCAHCNYNSLSKAKLYIHLRCMHIQMFTGQKYLCPKCGISMSSIYKLNNHAGCCSGVLEVEKAKIAKNRKKPRARRKTLNDVILD